MNKKILMVLMISLVIFSLAGVSAELITFDNVKSYDLKTKTVTIKNLFGLGTTYADVKLDTPQIYEVGVGYTKVAQFTINSYENYSEFIGNLEFYDLNNNNKDIEKQIDIKYLTLEKVVVNDLGDCINPKEYLQECEREIIGSHLENKEIWNDFDGQVRKDGIITIGLFTITTFGERIEWIPKLAGVKVPEWATYVATITTDAGWSDDSDGRCKGTRIHTNNYNLYFHNFTKSASFSGTQAYILWANTTTFATVTFSGDVADFDEIILLPNSDYFLTMDGGANSKYKSTATPISITDAQVTGYVTACPSTFGTGTVFGVINVGIGNESLYSPAPTITLNAPANDTTQKTNSVLFNVTISDLDPDNVTLYLDGVVNETNSTGIQGDYLFTKILTDGDHDWLIESCAVGVCGNSSSWEITIDTTPFIEWLTPPTLPNYANITQEYIPMKVNVSTPYYKNNSFDIYNVNGTSFHQDYTDQTFDINFTDLPDSHYHYNATICTTTDQCNSTETRHINHDVTPPEIFIDSPIGESNYLYVGQLLELNFTAIDELANVSECWTNYNGTNNSIACTNGTLVSVPIAQEYGRTSANVYSNDTFGNEGSNSTSWTYKILEIDKEFNNETTEGAYEQFTLNLNEGGSAMVQSVILHYNGQTDTSSLFSSGSNVTAVSELLIDGVSADTNKTFYFTITLTDSTTFNTTSAVQLVHDITIDDCSANPYPLLYLYLKDEEARTLLSGTIETNVEILNNFNFAQVLNISQQETGVSYVDLCSNVLLNETAFLINAEIRYNSENHSAEFYHIQKAALTNYPVNLSLFDLKTEDTTIFKVLYRNQDLIGVEGAVLQLQRKYISDGIYEVVEAPLTSSDSSGILHIDTNTNKYQITVVKEGEVLGLFQNLVFICESELTGECTLNLYDKLIPPNIVPLIDLQDFSSAVETSIDDQTITLTYVVPSGTATSIQVLAVQKDTILGDSVICNQTVISSAGSIECAYATTIQDSKITYKVFKSGELIAEKGYVVQEDLRDDWGGANYILLVVLMLSLVFMALSSPEWVVINAVIVVLLGGGLWLIRGIGFVEGLGSLMWLIVGAIILISKLAKQEDF